MNHKFYCAELNSLSWHGRTFNRAKIKSGNDASYHSRLPLDHSKLSADPSLIDLLKEPGILQVLYLKSCPENLWTSRQLMVEIVDRRHAPVWQV